MDRANKLKLLMLKNGIDACLLTKPANVSYISGFNNDGAYVLILKDKRFLFTDFRYMEQAQREVLDFEIIQITAFNLILELSDILKQNAVSTLWFEDEFMVYAFYKKLKEYLNSVELIPMGNTMEEMRSVKDKDEMAAITAAASIADKVFNRILGYIKPGITEQQLAARIEYMFKEEGCEDVSFPPIVASGKHSSMPHARPTGKSLEKGDFVVLDFGGIYDGYCSDMTRTLVLGRASTLQRQIYDIVLRAQCTAIENIRVGMDCRQVDALARDLIASYGYNQYFGHSLGHGVGREIHEQPVLSPTAKGHISEGVVVTIEPGIYLPGVGGVRIEDLVIVKSDHIDDLTSSTKTLIEL